jgi:DNA-binding MarR family transcriptional regulator
VLAGGGDVAPDGVACRVVSSLPSPPEIFCWVLAGRAPFGLAGSGRDPQVIDEAQDVVVAVAQCFEQGAVLALDRQPGITGATLARASLVTPQAMMVVLKSLEEQGLIVRSPHPRHPNVLELHITDAGCEVLDAARHRVEPVERRVTDTFSPEELEVLGALLTRWIAAPAGARERLCSLPGRIRHPMPSMAGDLSIGHPRVPASLAAVRPQGTYRSR